MTGDLPPGTTTAHVDARYAEGLEYPCRLCASAEAEPPTFDLCPNCIADAAAKHRPNPED